MKGEPRRAGLTPRTLIRWWRVAVCVVCTGAQRRGEKGGEGGERGAGGGCLHVGDQRVRSGSSKEPVRACGSRKPLKSHPSAWRSLKGHGHLVHRSCCFVRIKCPVRVILNCWARAVGGVSVKLLRIGPCNYLGLAGTPPRFALFIAKGVGGGER